MQTTKSTPIGDSRVFFHCKTKDCLASICTSVLCKERSYKYQHKALYPLPKQHPRLTEEILWIILTAVGQADIS